MTKEELIKSREKKVLLPQYDWEKFHNGEKRMFNGVDLNDNKHTDFVYGDIKVKPGQFFLYEATIGGYLHYPKLAIFLKSGPLDMTVDTYFMNVERTSDWRLEYEYSHDGKTFTNLLAEDKPEIQNIILWDDSMDVYGAWDKMPNWKELLAAYRKTIWFSKSIEDKRDGLLNTILK